MSKTISATIARTRNAAGTTRYAPIAFRAANAPRPFRRGDIAMVMAPHDAAIDGQMVIVCVSDRSNDGAHAEIAVRFTRGSSSHVQARSLQLLAAVDAHEFGPVCDDLLAFVDGRGPANA